MFEEDKSIGSFNDMLIKLHEGFNLGYSDRGRYGLFNTSDGVLSFRIKDHNANGNNFAKDNEDKNISIYVAYAEYEQPETTIPYTEFRYSQEDFENNMDEIYADIINAMDKAINGDGFPNKLKFAEKKDYPQFSIAAYHGTALYNDTLPFDMFDWIGHKQHSQPIQTTKRGYRRERRNHQQTRT